MMRHRKKGMFFIVMVFMLAASMACSQAVAGDIRVVTSQATPVDSIGDEDVQSIFLGKKSTWAGGNAVEFVILEDGATHDTFLKIFVKKSSSQFSTYWKKQVFTGKGNTPKAFASEDELVAYVSAKPGAVGYVSSATAITGLKVINEK